MSFNKLNIINSSNIRAVRVLCIIETQRTLYVTVLPLYLIHSELVYHSKYTYRRCRVLYLRTRNTTLVPFRKVYGATYIISHPAINPYVCRAHVFTSCMFFLLHIHVTVTCLYDTSFRLIWMHIRKTYNNKNGKRNVLYLWYKHPTYSCNAS